MKDESRVLLFNQFTDIMKSFIESSDGETRVLDITNKKDILLIEENIESLNSIAEHIMIANNENKLIKHVWTDSVLSAYFAVFDTFNDKSIFYFVLSNDNIKTVEDIRNCIADMINLIVLNEIGEDIEYNKFIRGKMTFLDELTKGKED